MYFTHKGGVICYFCSTAGGMNGVINPLCVSVSLWIDHRPTLTSSFATDGSATMQERKHLAELHIYMYTYTGPGRNKNGHTYICTYICVYIYIYVYIYIFRIHICIYIYMYICIYKRGAMLRMHIYIYIFIYIHTHTYKGRLRRRSVHFNDVVLNMLTQSYRELLALSPPLQRLQHL